MRFGTRTFFCSFIPFALLLMGSFWAIQKLVESTVKSGVRASMRDTQKSIARIQTKSELQNSRFLKIVGENATLKAGLQLLLSDPGGRDARLTVEDQLRDFCKELEFDFLMVSDPNGKPLSAVARIGDNFQAVDTAQLHPPGQRGLLTIAGRIYQFVSIPVNQADENLGLLAIGERFDFTEFSTPTILTHNGKVLNSSVEGVSTPEIEAAVHSCGESGECEVHLRGETYLSLPIANIYFGDGYLLRSLQNVDSVGGPVQSILNNIFVFVSFGAFAATLLLSAASSRSIAKPIAVLISHLRRSENTGLLPEFLTAISPIQEIRELTSSFNRAAAAVREGRENLHRAYVQSVGSLANALDARDPYTAGHSYRVSALSCSIAAAMNLPGDQLEDLRVGALLHDIGKIGIADCVLQNPGQLTDAEFELVKQHPTIGRKILEGVNGFQAYLPTVELHHENWDGTGYPLGLAGESVPLNARIVHIADAYDAMTTDRPYRRGMNRQAATRVLQDFAGTQFDPTIVAVFSGLKNLPSIMVPAGQEGAIVIPQISNLAKAVEGVRRQVKEDAGVETA